MKAIILLIIMLTGQCLSINSPVACRNDIDCAPYNNVKRDVHCLYPGDAKACFDDSVYRGYCAYLKKDDLILVYNNEAKTVNVAPNNSLTAALIATQSICGACPSCLSCSCWGTVCVR